MDRNSRCDLADQTSIYSDGKVTIERKLFENKTYYTNGLTKTLNIVFTGIFGEADSLQYSYQYSFNAALVHVKSTDRRGTKTIYDLNVTFDPKTGFATKIGNDAIVYEDRRMKSYGTSQFLYDDRGNLLELFIQNPVSGVGGLTRMKFYYDLTKSGGQQEFYSTMDFDALQSTFCMAEILGWIPTSGSPNRRIKKELVAGEDILAGESYSDHQYNNGKLMEFKRLYKGSIIGDVIKNTWKCK